MATIIFKIILCSALLIGIYYLFLQKEKTFRFNRFYLIFGLIFSYTIPFVKISWPAISQQKSQFIFDEVQTQQLLQNTNQNSQLDWPNLILILYVSVSIVLILKSLTSIFKIFNLKGIDLKYQNQNVKLIEKNWPPFSFWNKIYLNKIYFENGQIDNRIFLHEQAHLSQKHTLDLIFIELIHALSWFNPAIYFFKKAIITNHEFLADEVIMERKFDVRSYQQLILTEVINAQKLSLINPFNFNNTKQRFIMMTTKKSNFEKVKKTFAIAAIAGLSIVFVQKVYASENDPNNFGNPETAAVADTVKSDTIPQKKQQQATKIKAVKKAEKSSTLKQLKENELPIPPPPPPAREGTPAEFPEGLNALRMAFSNAFNAEVFTKRDGTLKTSIYITIDENGKTKDVRAEGPNPAFNNEAVRTLKVVTQDKLWKPATEEGKAAATVFQFPITMNFQ